MTEEASKLGSRVRDLRLQAGLTKAGLAKKIGASDVSVGYWESGTIKTINHALLMRLAEVFSITVSELVDDPQLEDYDAALLARHASALQSMADDAIGEESVAMKKAADYLRKEAQAQVSVDP